jgi:hypothetical protein
MLCMTPDEVFIAEVAIRLEAYSVWPTSEGAAVLLCRSEL